MTELSAEMLEIAHNVLRTAQLNHLEWSGEPKSLTIFEVEAIAGALTVAERRGYDTAIEMLRGAAFEPMPKPTIEELEKILNSPAPAVRINPDGSITAGLTSFEKAADWLDANRPMVEPSVKIS